MGYYIGLSSVEGGDRIIVNTEDDHDNLEEAMFSALYVLFKDYTALTDDEPYNVFQAIQENLDCDADLKRQERHEPVLVDEQDRRTYDHLIAKAVEWAPDSEGAFASEYEQGVFMGAVDVLNEILSMEGPSTMQLISQALQNKHGRQLPSQFMLTGMQ